MERQKTETKCVLTNSDTGDTMRFCNGYRMLSDRKMYSLRLN